jgi:ribosomal protein S18 acetylase RimI-like enzyme
MMQIRDLTGADASEYWRVRLRALGGDPEAFSSSVEEHRALGMDEIVRRLEAMGGGSFVKGAFEEGVLVGTAGFHHEMGPKTRHKGRIWGVYMVPEHRGKGVGRSLLQAVLERASQTEGIKQILLSVTSSQVAAGKLYRSLGFEVYGCEPDALKIGGRFIAEEHMILYVKRGIAEI